MKPLRWPIALLFLVLTTFALAGVASAHMGAERFKVEKRSSVPPTGPRGQLAVKSLTGGDTVRLLRGEDGDFTGVFEVDNTGPGPLLVNRVFVLDAEDDPRSPPGLSALPETPTRSAIPAGGSRRFRVMWRPGDARAKELFAELVIDTDAAQPGATVVDAPKVIGVVAERRAGVMTHVASILVLLPLLAALLAAISRFVPALDPRRLRVVAAAVLALEAFFGAWMLAGFDRELGKRDGNEGLQFIERAVIDGKSGIELYLGVDGLSVAVAAVIAVVGLVGVLSSDASSPASRRNVGAAGLMVSGAMLVVLAQTSFLFVLGWALAGAGATMVALAVSRRAGVRVALSAIASTVLLGVWARAMATHTGAVYLSDGTEAAAVYGFPDLARAHFSSIEGAWLGLPPFRAMWLSGFLGVSAFLAVPPLMGWLGGLVAPMAADAAEREATADSWPSLVASVLPALAAYGVVRMIVIAPDAARWGGESLPAIGAVLVAIGGLAALFEGSLPRIGIHLAMTRTGLFLLAAFSLTPEGLASASGLVASLPVAALTFHLAASRVSALAGGGALERLVGLGRSAPLSAGAIVLGAAALAGLVLPGLSAQLLGVTGSFGRNPAVTVAAMLGLGAVALAVARTAKVAFGEPPASLRSEKQLEPFGGAVPDLRRGDAASWMVLALSIVLLAAVPRSFVDAADQLIRDVYPRLDPDGPTRVAAVDTSRPPSRFS